jgi:hydroxyacylglutathione hydrolase
MKIEQMYTGCLAEAAYYIESEGEAVIIDPLRDVEPYIERAQADNAKIKYVLETHFHADFVSGHLDLAKQTGATIVYGPTAKPGFQALIAEDNEVLKVGKLSIKVLHTPGHTMESSTYLLTDENGKDIAIFTGDTLFLGDVGRPDLAQKAGSITQEDLAGWLFDSLRNRIMPLADDVIVYPGHGAGSSCGKKMAAETTGTLGEQKKSNYALRADMTRDEFIKEVTDGLMAPPQYFPKNAVMNKMGYDSIDNVRNKGLRPLSVRAFKAAWEGENALVLDTRLQDEFAKNFIPGAIFVGIDDNFAPWVGALVEDLTVPILFVCEPGREQEVVDRLARVGYDNPIGYLEGGFNAWVSAGEETDSIKEVYAREFESIYNNHKVNLLDVRRNSEYNAQHIVGAQNFPLDFINKNMSEVDRHNEYYLHCVGGYRSMITASILRSRGFDKLINIRSGFRAIQEETKLPLTEFVEQTTEL